MIFRLEITRFELRGNSRYVVFCNRFRSPLTVYLVDHLYLKWNTFTIELNIAAHKIIFAHPTNEFDKFVFINTTFLNRSKCYLLLTILKSTKTESISQTQFSRSCRNTNATLNASRRPITEYPTCRLKTNFNVSMPLFNCFDSTYEMLRIYWFIQLWFYKKSTEQKI